MIDYKNVKLVVTDMDGTLLHSDYSLNQEFFTLYEQLKELDIKFSVASGRQYYSLLNIFENIKEEIYFIAENGGNVMYQNQSVLVQRMDEGIIQESVKIGRTIPNTGILLCGLKKAYVANTDMEFAEYIDQYYPENEVVGDLLDSIDDQIIKIALYNKEGSEQNVYPFVKHLGEKHSVQISGMHWVDISNKDSNKGTALKKVQQILNISKEETMVFGDYLNDLEMIKQSYYSFAMENAHPELKELARFKTDTNNEDGVLKVLREVIRQNKKTR